MKFLVLGCNGMAGHLISLYLSEKGHDVTGFAISKSPYVKTICGDAMDASFLQEILIAGNYDTVINCIGILNQDAELHKDKAVILNSWLPHYLAEITSDMNTQVIQMSTDCVFSGERGNYVESDLCDGRSFYDRSKALGELNDGKNVTFRNSIVGPDINVRGIGLLNWFMQQNDCVYGFTRAFWTGQTTLQLAKSMEAAAQNRINGLYNMVPSSGISKFDLLKLFNKYLRHSAVNLIPNDKVVVDKTLKRTNFDFDYLVPDYEIMIKELAEWMNFHKSLYPHYQIGG